MMQYKLHLRSMGPDFPLCVSGNAHLLDGCAKYVKFLPLSTPKIINDLLIASLSA